MFGNLIVPCEVDYPPINGRNKFLLGSCNGIICFVVDGVDIFLWNPSTRRFKFLPALGFGFIHAWGFGFRESKDDYKVVVISDDVNVKYPIVHMYSLRTDSWNYLGAFHFGIPDRKFGTFAGGRLYFVVRPIEKDGYKTIVSMDLENESFYDEKMPNLGEHFSRFTLGELGGCLSLFCYKRCPDIAWDRSTTWDRPLGPSVFQDTRAYGWIQKEDGGGKKSWTKVVSVNYFDHVCRYPHSNQLLTTLGDKFLLALGTYLVVYNPKDKSLTRHDLTTYESLINVHCYSESLVPL